MPTLFLVRHGKAAAGFDAHLDPGLDALGRTQAERVASLLRRHGPIAVYSSPLARARETALPLLEQWGTELVIEPRISEIPTPESDLADRAAWLSRAMAGRWSHLDNDLQRWRQSLIDYLLAIKEDSIVFSHFIAINVAVGAARNDDRLVCFRPDNGSVTRLSNADARLRVIELGRENESLVG